MVHEWHTGNKRMHVWLFQPGQIAFDQYRVTGDAGEVAESAIPQFEGLRQNVGKMMK